MEEERKERKGADEDVSGRKDDREIECQKRKNPVTPDNDMKIKKITCGPLIVSHYKLRTDNKLAVCRVKKKVE